MAEARRVECRCSRVDGCAAITRVEAQCRGVICNQSRRLRHKFHSAVRRGGASKSSVGGYECRIAGFREGVLYVPELNVDAFFVTLTKSEADYSPTTMYRDYPISPTLFHWESQNQT